MFILAVYKEIDGKFKECFDSFSHRLMWGVKNMTTLWVLVANSAYACIYEVKGLGKDIKKIHKIEHPESRMKAGEALSDKPGRTFASVGTRRSSMSPHIDYKVQQQQIFAKEIAHLLQQNRNEHKFDELAIIAPAQFLGELNQELPETVRKSITKHLSKDLPEYLNEQEQINYICKNLDLWNH